MPWPDELPDEWRDRARTVNDPSSPTLLVDCAEELEAALEEEMLAKHQELRLEGLKVDDVLGDLKKLMDEREELRRFVEAMAAEKNRTCNCPERMLERFVETVAKP